MNRLLTMFIVLLFVTVGCAQQRVGYIPEKPVIDGKLDDVTRYSNLKRFNTVVKSDKDNADIPVSYLLGYGKDFLYLYIEQESPVFVKRDRAYQNGDGFHMVIGAVKNGETDTDEFYVLAFSPDEKAFGHKNIWYYNIDLSFKPLGEDVLYKTAVSDTKVSHELLIPWSSVHPYHPWFRDDIGINICYVKALGEEDKNYYFILRDDKIQYEQSRRKLVKTEFGKPITGNHISVHLDSCNTTLQTPPKLKISGYSDSDMELKYSVKLYSGENVLISKQYTDVICTKGLFTDEISITKKSLIPGGYRVNVKESDNEYDFYFTVMPQFNYEQMVNRLYPIKSRISEGAYNTLLLYIKELDAKIKKLKSYENSYDIRSRIKQVEIFVKKAESGIDPFNNRRGTFRRGFVSDIDNSVRPYAVYIPEDYDKTKKMPLLVYLHGSGEDERTLYYAPNIKNGYIVIAPNGRGTSNCYSTSESQKDINEAINDVIKNYNIDTYNIILSGFSMGGYGVYQTYYKNPDRYSAVAVLAGHPDLGPKWGFADGKNFLKRKNIKVFSDVEMFIFHGTNDRNCKFNLTEELVDKLKSVGARVKFVTESTGHGGMNRTNRELYYKWLKERVER
ncbi:MAG: prolyl oligopeptidase family serine peptidase [Bacteroidales bacterium]|nr:prolyl oligopeptidase family serine peptidase [Bacteroidales bacterium]